MRFIICKLIELRFVFRVPDVAELAPVVHVMVPASAWGEPIENTSEFFAYLQQVDVGLLGLLLP